MSMHASYNHDPDMREDILDEKREWMKWTKIVEQLQSKQQNEYPDSIQTAKKIIEEKCVLLKPRPKEQIETDELVRFADNILCKIIKHLEQFSSVIIFDVDIEGSQQYVINLFSFIIFYKFILLKDLWHSSN